MHGHSPSVASVHGVVAAAHPLAAEAGAAVLRGGGNAFDAASATGAALNVCEPYMSGLAGMGVAICYVASLNEVLCLDFCPNVPAAFDISRVAARSEIRRGAYGVGAPGCLAGWSELNRRFGKLDFGTILEPAIRLATDGIPLIELNVEALDDADRDLRGFSELYPEWSKVFPPDEGARRFSSVLRQGNLSQTLRTISERGISHLYDGDLGTQICKTVQSLGGCLSMCDIQSVSPKWASPLETTFFGNHVYVPPPPSHGFQFLLTLKLLEQLHAEVADSHSSASFDRIVRAIRLAAAFRIQIGIPSSRVVTDLLSDAGILDIAVRTDEAATLLGRTEFPSADSIRPLPSENTTSFSVGDREGNLVCITQSLGQYFGSGIVVPNTGVCLNDLLQYDNLDPASDNCIRGGSPLSLPFAPTFVQGDQCDLQFVLGTPGSFGISQTQAQVLFFHLKHGMTLRASIEAPRARVLDGPRVLIEGRVPSADIQDLRAKGHDAEPIENWSKLVGGMQAVQRNRTSGAMIGIADVRRDGYVATA